MTNLRKYIRAASYLLLFFCFSNNINYASANKILEVNSKTQNSRLTLNQYIKLQEYAYNYITNNKDSIKLEKNESGFYRIRINKPDFLDNKLNIDKLRLNYWPVDNSNPIVKESIHDHPSYFESYILYGGYVHSTYFMQNTKYNTKSKEMKLYRINKNYNGSKSFDSLGNVFINKIQDEKVKEGQIVVMSTDVIHRVLYSVPGSLSLNVVYKDKTNKDCFNTFVSKNGSEKDVILTRPIISGLTRKTLLDQIENKLFNSMYQKNSGFSIKN